MALDLKRYLFTVEEYDQMVEAGILAEDDRLELIDGEVIEMTPIGHRHAWCVASLVQLLGDALGRAAVVWPQNPIRLGRHSEPVPDVALLRPRSARKAIPTPEDVLLLVEVAASSLEPDRRVKVPLYARHGIAEAWLVDLEQRTISVYLDPTPDGYRTVRVVRPGERLAPAAFPDRAVAVDDILSE